MLLDRKKIRKWAKWVALALAIIFAVSFLTMGVGYGVGSFNLFASLGCGTSSDTTEPQTSEDQLNAYLQTLEANPNDTTTMLAIATVYEEMYEAEGGGTDYLVKAAAFLENAIDVDPSLKDVYLRLASLYIDDMKNNEAAVTVLNKAASLDPTNPQVFLQLGIAQQNLGNKQAAVLAWQKYLELEPNGDMASVIREQLTKLTETTTTTASITTTTGSGGTTTTAASTTTTAATTTTTTAP